MSPQAPDNHQGLFPFIPLTVTETCFCQNRCPVVLTIKPTMMQKRKLHLQRHRLRAFAATLEQVECRLERDIKFLTDFAEIYKFPKRITRRNLKQYKKMMEAAKLLKAIYKEPFEWEINPTK